MGARLIRHTAHASRHSYIEKKRERLQYKVVRFIPTPATGRETPATDRKPPVTARKALATARKAPATDRETPVTDRKPPVTDRKDPATGRIALAADNKVPAGAQSPRDARAGGRERKLETSRTSLSRPLFHIRERNVPGPWDRSIQGGGWRTRTRRTSPRVGTAAQSSTSLSSAYCAT